MPAPTGNQVRAPRSRARPPRLGSGFQKSLTTPPAAPSPLPLRGGDKWERDAFPSSLEEGWRPKAAGVVSRLGSLCVRQEKLEQIVEKALPQVRRPDALVVPRDHTARLGFPQLPFGDRDLQTGALHERSDRKAVGQAQGVHHEFEHQVVAPDLVGFLHRVALGDPLEIFPGLLPARGPRDAIVKTHFAVGARPDAEVIAEAPVVEIVAAFAA